MTIPGPSRELMDWRAKSQSRSRSRLPDAMMDWRAQSRSRSRAPDFRIPPVPLPPVASYDSVNAQLTKLPVAAAPTTTSRFYGDHGGLSPEGAVEEEGHFDLAASLGLAPGEYSTTYGEELDFSLLSAKTTAGPKIEENASNLSSIENILSTLQSLAPATDRASFNQPWSSVNTPLSNGQSALYGHRANKPLAGEGYSLAQQQLQQVVNQVGSIIILSHAQ
jgi:hypothetical protein